MKHTRTGLLLAAVVLTLASVVAGPTAHWLKPTVAHAQSSMPRTVSGAVLDDKEQPVVGATVLLKNLKTKAIRSFSSVEKGHYRFAQLNNLEDYELWAEMGGKKSTVKTISTWDTRSDLVTDLKLK